MSKQPDFKGFLDFQKNKCLNFWEFSFFLFLAVSWEQKELPEIPCCQELVFWRDFQIFELDTRPEHPKGTKNKVKRPKGF